MPDWPSVFFAPPRCSTKNRPIAATSAIYAWSNAGALAGLLAYPFLVEPFTDLTTQNWVWAGGGSLVCLLALRDRAGTPAVSPPRRAGLGKTRWQWWVLPGLSSATLLATTNLLSFEASAGPLTWALPLALFLATYVWAFSGNRRASCGIIATLGLVALTVSHFIGRSAQRLAARFGLDRRGRDDAGLSRLAGRDARRKHARLLYRDGGGRGHRQRVDGAGHSAYHRRAGGISHFDPGDFVHRRVPLERADHPAHSGHGGGRGHWRHPGGGIQPGAPRKSPAPARSTDAGASPTNRRRNVTG